MSLFGRHHWTRTAGTHAADDVGEVFVPLAPDGTCPWCRATFPVDTLRDEHAATCPARPQEDA